MSTKLRGDDRYFELVRDFELLPITSDKEHKAAIEVILSLTARDGQLTAAEIGYGQVLGFLISEYEKQKLGDYFTKERATGREVLAYLLEQNNLQQVEVAAIAGVVKQTISNYLAGRRPLPKEARYRLAKRFQLSPELFDAPVGGSKSSRPGKPVITLRDARTAALRTQKVSAARKTASKSRQSSARKNAREGRYLSGRVSS